MVILWRSHSSGAGFLARVSGIGGVYKSGGAPKDVSFGVSAAVVLVADDSRGLMQGPTESLCVLAKSGILI